MFVRQAKESNYYFVLKSFYFNNQVVDKKLWRWYLKLKDYDWNTLRPMKLYLSIINKHLFHIFSIFLAIQPTGAGTKKGWLNHPNGSVNSIFLERPQGQGGAVKN